MAKAKKTVMTTDIGTLVWPHVMVADEYQGKERYKADIRLTGDAATALKDMVDNKLISAKKKQAILEDDDDIKYKSEYVGYEEEGDGSILFKSALNRWIKKGTPQEREQRPAIFDSKGNLTTDTTLEVFSGTQARVTVEVYDWTMDGPKIGVSLRTQAVQLIKLADKPVRDADSYGFDAVEGGFDVDAVADMAGAGEAGSGTREEF